MSAGRWTQCTAPIAFFEDGDLADGQHRLWAVVESGQSQKFLVIRGLSRKDGLNIDTGLNRSLVDAGRISGTDAGLTNELVAAARGINDGGPTGKGYSASSYAHRVEIVKAHRDAAEWACSNGPRGRLIRNAITLAAVGRAWYHYKDNPAQLARLKHFCDVMSKGLTESQDEFAAQVTRNYMLQKASAATTSAMWIDTFLKVQRAIAYFMDRKPVTVLRAQSEEAYPLKRGQQIRPNDTPKPAKRAAKKAVAR